MNVLSLKLTGSPRFSSGRVVRFLAGIGVLGWTCALSVAQPGKSLPATPTVPGKLASPADMNRVNEVRAADLVAQIQAKLAAARSELGRGAGTNLPPAATATEALEYQHTLQGLARLYQEHLEDLVRVQAADAAQDAADVRADATVEQLARVERDHARPARFMAAR